MEAERNRLAKGEPSGGEQPLSDAQLGPSLPHSSILKSAQQTSSQPTHGSLGRHYHRPPKRSATLHRIQQQQSQMQSASGPSGSSFTPLPSSSSSSIPSSSSPALPAQGPEAQEGGTTSRRERKPQKPGKYVCTYCGRPCAKPSVLQKHVRSHTGERPYPCVPCGFSFKTKSNLYKHRKSHAHRIKAGLVSSRDEHSLSGPEGGAAGDEPEEHTEGESTDSEDETGQGRPSTSQERPTLKKSSHVEISFSEDTPKPEDSQAVKQRLAMRLSERKRVPVNSPDERLSSSSLGPGSKGSTESGYFSRSGSAELSQISPPSANAKTYAEIILGKYGRQQQRTQHQQHAMSSSSSSPSSSSAVQEKTIPFTVPKTQVIEHITNLITINEAVVDTSEIDSVKPRRSSLSRRSSIESPKYSLPKDPCALDSKSDVPSSSGTSCQHGSSMTLLRSHSMPSSAGNEEPPVTASCSFRMTQSFDEQQAVAAEIRVGHHHRMLRRQPAIEVPLTADLIPEQAGSSTSTVMERVLVPEQLKDSGLYECEACGTGWKKRESFEAHRDLCMGKTPHVLAKGKESSFFREDRPQMMHYKFRAMAMAVRKRRKEESLEEDPPSPGPAAVTFSSVATFSACGEEESKESFSGNITQAEHKRKGAWKEISVIQHTSSFEKQESMSIEIQEPELEEQQPSAQQPKPPPSSRLVRQPNIQVPEILVTEEPDTDVVLASPPAVVSKEPEKVEEFQWPQRSQSLAQLPAEKLPPKKKRLRLAEAMQSSGESSFESISLPRSPSQESNVSHSSSRSASFEDSGKLETELALKGLQSSHMLTVPSGHQQHHHANKEMRRSASEQAPASPPNPSQIVESRSKSFDYGSLSPQQSSGSWKERRKCLLVKHATLGEQEQDLPLGQITKPGSPKVCFSYHSPPAFSSEDRSMASTSSRLSPESIGKTLQLFQSPILPLHPASPEAISPNQFARILPVTTAISGVLSTQILHRAFLQTVTPPVHAAQFHLDEHSQTLPASLPLSYQSGMTQAVYFPVPGGLTIQVPTVPTVPNSRPSTSVMHSPIPAHQQLVALHHNTRPIITPCLEQLTPVVSLVVPVRLQTHIPTYANAMYTTISQILVTTQSQEPICCTAMVIMGQLEQDKLQRSYLKIPTPDFKSYLSMSLPLELAAGMGTVEGYGQLSAGGSKRMLSPSGSLELSTEAQRQQKRVKEEEEDHKEEEGDGTIKIKEVIETQFAQGGEIETKGKNEIKNSCQEFIQGDVEPFKKEEKEDKKNLLVEVLDRSRRSSHPRLHTTTSVSWCYLNYIKPNPSTQREPQNSVYSSWCVSVHNPNLPGLSTKMVLSLLHSKQKHSLETYTMATAPPPTNGKLVPAQKRTPSMSEVTEVSSKETKPTKETKTKSEEGAPSSSKQGDPPRVRIFEGGYKSNEEYVYVRGRGRGKYICGECGIRCKKPSMLKKHIRTHTDVRPYSCKHCNFAFKTKGNLTKHMKSKAHGKKCQEMGVSESSVDEGEPEDAGGSEEHVLGAEEQEHQFSDVEESEEDDDYEEDDDDFSSHDDPPSCCSTDTRPSTSGHSDSGQSLYQDPADLQDSESEPGPSQEYPSSRRPWTSGRTPSPGNKRALFSRRHWEASPRGFSPGSEGSPIRSLSPRLQLSSPRQHLSPSPERGPSPSSIQTLSPIRPLSPLRPHSPGRYRSSRAHLSPAPLRAHQHRHRSSPAHLSWDSPSPQVSIERSGSARQGLLLTETGLASPTLCLFPGESTPPSTPRIVDHMFSHLPLHSQDQARVPYHMIPIGGIQMVQARQRAKLERSSSSTASSPTSPKEDILLFQTRRDHPSRMVIPGTSGIRTQNLSESSSQSVLSTPRMVTSLPTLSRAEEHTTHKEYGSSHTSSEETQSLMIEKSDLQATGYSEGPGGIFSGVEAMPMSSTQRTRQSSEKEESPKRHGSVAADGDRGEHSAAESGHSKDSK
uniref:Transcription factor HIVEP3 n=1 Tax=Denticeps clupeoides TaxID=299321 RepID=A0AAY4A9E5_9TELE